MKPQLTLTLVLLLVPLQFMSRRKDDCESCTLPPKAKPTEALKAKAGDDQSIPLPTNFAFLDDRRSTPFNGKITYSWSKISGPASFHIPMETFQVFLSIIHEYGASIQSRAGRMISLNEMGTSPAHCRAGKSNL
jgi:hypothetical protein